MKTEQPCWKKKKDSVENLFEEKNCMGVMLTEINVRNKFEKKLQKSKQIEKKKIELKFFLSGGPKTPKHPILRRLQRIKMAVSENYVRFTLKIIN